MLAVLAQSIPIESGCVMVPAPGQKIAAHEGYRAALGTSLDWTELGRFEFYETCRSPDLAIVVATGDQRIYANLLLTIGVRT